MELAVVGSRSFDDYGLLEHLLDVLQPTKIISGGAKGADSLAEKYAKAYNIPTKIYEAEWQDFSEPCKRKTGKYGEYNALAGFKRNQQIVDAAEYIIAFWDGESPGTKDTIQRAHQSNTPIKVISV